MKMFFQGKGEGIIIDENITVIVLNIDDDEVLLEIDAPEWLEIDGNEASSLENELEGRSEMERVRMEPVAASIADSIRLSATIR